MKKMISTFGAVLFLSVLLAACNTDISEPIVTGANEQQPEDEQVSNEPEQTEEQQEEPATTPTNTTEEPKTDSIDDNETLTYTSNGQPFSEEVVTAKSEEMDYTIQHFKNFTLVAEEPGIDQLLYDEDGTLSMQIEVVKAEDASFDQIKTSANETMAAISSENLKDLDLSAISAKREDIKNIVGYETMLEDEKVVKIVFERENLFAVLTIYDNLKSDLTDAFMQMGLTIQ